MTTDGIRNYFYDRENRMVKVVKIADGSTLATYEYDYRGLRISKTTAAGTIRYHWDNKDRLVRESDTGGNTLALYIYDDKDQLQAIEKGGAIYYTHTNARGDILAITDAAGNRVATYKYGPWGELLSQTGTFDQPFRYAGYYYDSETGMYYLKARYYSPDLGRFLTKDTFEGFNENPQTLNLYAYANGNPVVNVDPTGHIAWWIVKSVLVAGTGAFTGVIGYVLQIAITGQEFSWWSLAYNAGTGAVLNVVSGFFGLPSSKVRQMLWGTGKSLVTYVAQNYKNIGYNTDFLSGAAISIVTGAVGELIKYKSARRYVEVKNMLNSIRNFGQFRRILTRIGRV